MCLIWEIFLYHIYSFFIVVHNFCTPFNRIIDYFKILVLKQPIVDQAQVSEKLWAVTYGCSYVIKK